MKKQATLSAKLNRLVLPIIILPLILSGCLAFWVYYRDAGYRLDHYVNDRVKDIQALAKAPAVEQFFISREFYLTEETSFYREKIDQLLAGYLMRPHADGQFYQRLILADHSGTSIAQQGATTPLRLPHASSIGDYLPKIKTLGENAVFQTHDRRSMVQAVAIRIDLNADQTISGSEFCGVIVSLSANPMFNFLEAAINAGLITLVILVVALFCGFFLTKRFIHKITLPLSDLASHVEHISDGDFKVFNPTGTSIEIANLAASFNQMQAELKESNTRIRKQIDLLKSLNILSRKISSSLKLEEVLTLFAAGLQETLHFVQLQFAIFQGDGDPLRYISKMDDDQFRFIASRMRPEDERFVNDFVDAHKSASTIMSPSQADRTPTLFPRLQAEAQLVGIPLRFLEKPIGVIWMAVDPEDTPTEEILDYLDSIAGQAAISLKNAMLFEEINEVKDLLEKDIIERERETREKEKLQAQLMQAYKMEAIGTLAGGIAHDFNNILSSIIGFTELALDDTQEGTLLEDNLQQVFIAAKRARELVKQILTFARQTDEACHPVRVDIIAKETFKLLRSSIPSTIRITQNIRSQSLVMGNPTQMQQIIMNLCTNAAHAMEQAGGTLSIGVSDEVFVADSPHRPESVPAGHYLKISIADTGPGIPVHALSSIFEPFYTTKAPGEGTGMGLAVVHGIVRKFDGVITVDSEPGKGTVFHVYLPVTLEPERSEDAQTETPTEGNERILFVDDERQFVEMGSQALSRLGYSVTAITSSVEALALFRRQSDQFDLVISDMTMPNLTGYDLAAELMKIKPGIPIILLTGYSKKITEEAAMGIGIKAFAHKPIIKRDLAEMVRRVLDTRDGDPATPRASF